MKFLFHGYDLTLAVVARRTLLFEPATDEQRFRLVWQPTQRFLDRITCVRRSVQITCFASVAYRFPKHTAGTCVNVYCLNLEGAGVYLGTVFSRQAEAHDRAARVAALKLTDPDEAQLLQQHGADSIIREQCFCRIPTHAESLTPEVLTSAVRWYFQTFAPKLVDAFLAWLSKTTGAELDRWITSEAERTAKPSVQPPLRDPDVPWGY